jgi:hypothetical protein
VSYLLAASRAISFHPISRTAAAPMLAAHMRASASQPADATTAPRTGDRIAA